jgi:hypothetical protein
LLTELRRLAARQPGWWESLNDRFHQVPRTAAAAGYAGALGTGANWLYHGAPGGGPIERFMNRRGFQDPETHQWKRAPDYGQWEP